MNSMFGEWYRQAQMEPKPGELDDRWKGIAILKERSDSRYAANLVRLHFSLSGLPDDFASEFRAVFFEIDSTFRMIGNENELRVLAGTTLYEIIQRSDTLADGVALLVLAAGFPELRRKAPLKDLLQAADKYAFDRGLALRRIVAKEKLSALTDIDSLLDSLNAEMASGTALSWAALEPILRAISTNVKEVSINADARLTASQRQYDALREESNIIWWLFGGAIKGSQKRYCEVSAAEAALSAAKDLSSLTHVLPPLIASPVYLERALGSHVATPVTLEDIAGVADSGSVVSTASLFPLKNCFAAVHRGKTAKAAAAAATKEFQLRGDSIGAGVMSLQFFRESLAERFLQHGENA